MAQRPRPRDAEVISGPGPSSVAESVAARVEAETHPPAALTVEHSPEAEDGRFRYLLTGGRPWPEGGPERLALSEALVISFPGHVRVQADPPFLDLGKTPSGQAVRREFVARIHTLRPALEPLAVFCVGEPRGAVRLRAVAKEVSPAPPVGRALEVTVAVAVTAPTLRVRSNCLYYSVVVAYSSCRFVVPVRVEVVAPARPRAGDADRDDFSLQAANLQGRGPLSVRFGAGLLGSRSQSVLPRRPAVVRAGGAASAASAEAWARTGSKAGSDSDSDSIPAPPRPRPVSQQLSGKDLKFVNRVVGLAGVAGGGGAAGRRVTIGAVSSLSSASGVGGAGGASGIGDGGDGGESGSLGELGGLGEAREAGFSLGSASASTSTLPSLTPSSRAPRAALAGAGATTPGKDEELSFSGFTSSDDEARSDGPGRAAQPAVDPLPLPADIEARLQGMAEAWAGPRAGSVPFPPPCSFPAAGAAKSGECGADAAATTNGLAAQWAGDGLDALLRLAGQERV